MEITVTGISHRTAPVAMREGYALPPPLGAELVRAVCADGLCAEALVLDTCNRTEIYAVGEMERLSAAELLKRVRALKHLNHEDSDSCFYSYRGADAVRHVFRVAASLDSQIVGEYEILGQMKDAYRRAVENHTVSAQLNKLMHGAFHVGKRVQAETHLGQGAASVSRAAVDLARGLFGGLANRAALVIGAGQATKLTAQALLAAGVAHLTVANRSLARAEELVETLRQPRQGKRAAPRATLDVVELEDVGKALARVDLAVSSTASPDHVLALEACRALRRTAERPLLIVDIAVPRDVDEQVGTLPHVHLHNIDDLGDVVQENRERRRQEVPRAEAIVEEETQAFLAWQQSLAVVDTIKDLQERADALQRAELDRYKGRFSAADREELERFAHGLTAKLLRQPIAFLRDGARNGHEAGTAKADLVRRLFNLGKAGECP